MKFKIPELSNKLSTKAQILTICTFLANPACMNHNINQNTAQITEVNSEPKPKKEPIPEWVNGPQVFEEGDNIYAVASSEPFEPMYVEDERQFVKLTGLKKIYDYIDKNYSNFSNIGVLEVKKYTEKISADFWIIHILVKCPISTHAKKY